MSKFYKDTWFHSLTVTLKFQTCREHENRMSKTLFAYYLEKKSFCFCSFCVREHIWKFVYGVSKNLTYGYLNRVLKNTEENKKMLQLFLFFFCLFETLLKINFKTWILDKKLIEKCCKIVLERVFNTKCGQTINQELMGSPRVNYAYGFIYKLFTIKV